MKCGAGCKRRIGAGAAIIFKGSGFYETDYKKRDGKPSARPETPKTEAKTEAKSEPKTESKTASKPKGTDQD
jgi:predicted nucleic acid-binding Zn ribbon protein